MNHKKTTLNNQPDQIRNIEVQFGQMASMMNERHRGSLPSALEVNPMR